MSRCFPFPPPGYEKKARTDDADLLKKEKHKEKKHKKEKKDKDKREGKEKKEKDRSDGKRSDKKVRREKHRDKKKDKEKDKDKDKNSTSEEKKITGRPESFNAEKLIQREENRDKERSCISNEKKQGHNGENHTQNSGLPDRAENSKFVQDRSSISTEKEQDHSREKHIRNSLLPDEPGDKQLVHDRSIISNEKKHGRSGEKHIRNSRLPEGAGARDSEFVQELGRRIRDEDKGTGSQLVEKLKGTEQKNEQNQWTDGVVLKGTGILADSKWKNEEKRIDNRKIDGQGIRGDTKNTAVVQNLAGMVQSRMEGIARPLEKNIEKRMEEKEKFKDREVDEKRGEKRKDKDKEKKSHGKDKEREKEKKKEEKVKVKSEHKKREQDKFKDMSKNDLPGILNQTSHVAKVGEGNTAAEENLKKRKQFEANGFLHEADFRPNKIPRPGPYPSTENGRKLEPCQTTIQLASDRQELDNLKVDNEKHKLNGVTDAQSLSISSRKSSCAVTPAEHIEQASMKPPHPDSKYLSQVLSIPKMEEWSDFDDQEWLFCSKSSSSKKPGMGSAGINDTPRVWAEALQIEAADICALPYVIPY